MFEPRKGPRYGDDTNILAGCRVMVLGESHYAKNPSEIGTTLPGYTSEVVDWFIGGRRYNPFFDNLSKAVLGSSQAQAEPDDIARFWDAAVFYNYVPVFVDGRSKAEGGNDRRPTEEMFRAGEEPFKVVQARYEPQAVIVCGLTLWSWLAKHLDGFEGPERDVIFYDDGRSVFARIHHPSYRKFDPDYWTPRLRTLVEMTAEPRRRGLKKIWQPDEASREEEGLNQSP